MEALKHSARDYPVVQQLITQIASSLSSKQSHEISAKHVHEAAVRNAIKLHDTPTYADNDKASFTKRNIEQRNVSAMNYNNNNNNGMNYRNNRRPQQGERRNGLTWLEAKNRGICTYCRDASAQHNNERKYNPIKQNFTGDVQCPLLLKRIESGEVGDRTVKRPR